MLQAVGKGIQSFANAENGLTSLFQALMDPADRTLSFLALDAARHIETKMQIVRAVAQAKLAGPQLAKATNLLNRLTSRGDVRNKLAHWTVGYWPAMRLADDAKKTQVVLLPPMASKHWAPVLFAPKTTTVKPITLRELRIFSKLCSELLLEFVRLANEISPPKDRAEDH